MAETIGLPQGELCRCGKVKSLENTSTRFRKGRRVYVHACRACRNERRRIHYANGGSEPKMPEAPPGRAYCKKCWETEGHLDINLFPIRKDYRGHAIRRNVCRYCHNEMRRIREGSRKDKEGRREASVNGTHVIHVVTKIEKADVEAVRTEGLNATLDATRNVSPDRHRRPPDLLRLASSQDAKLDRLYVLAWKSVRTMPRMIDSRIRGWIPNPHAEGIDQGRPVSIVTDDARRTEPCRSIVRYPITSMELIPFPVQP